MQTKRRNKILSMLLAALIAFSVFAAVPMTALASAPNSAVPGSKHDAIYSFDTSAAARTFMPLSGYSGPILTLDEVERTSNTEATIEFSSDKAGHYYYQVGGTVSSAGSLAAFSTPTSMSSGTNTISLRALSAGAQTVYIAGEDTSGFVGDLLTVTVPAYGLTNATITPATATFNKNSSADITVTLNRGSYSPQKLSNGSYTLVVNTDYTVSGNNYTIKASYLSSLALGSQTILFTMNGGTNPTLVITVSSATGAPTVTGTASMTLKVGYTATSSTALTISGSPAPTVTKTSGDSKITWNNSTKKLDIAAGLAVGTYLVVLKAANGITPDATFTFTVIVSAQTGTPGSLTMSNFVQVRTYTPNMFTDVNENAWYGVNQQKVVVNAYEYNLMSGYPDNTFNPTGSMTIAEAITIAARVNSIYTTGVENFVQGTIWYQVYVDYAIANGIINATDFPNYSAAATRAQMAYIFARSLPQQELKEQNTVYSIPDVNGETPYSAYIFMLYKAGVLEGNNTKGTFYPGNSVSRAEAAAIISRVILPATRSTGKTY